MLTCNMTALPPWNHCLASETLYPTRGPLPRQFFTGDFSRILRPQCASPKVENKHYSVRLKQAFHILRNPMPSSKQLFSSQVLGKSWWWQMYLHTCDLLVVANVPPHMRPAGGGECTSTHVTCSTSRMERYEQHAS